jgi:hypothetical protein
VKHNPKTSHKCLDFCYSLVLSCCEALRKSEDIDIGSAGVADKLQQIWVCYLQQTKTNLSGPIIELIKSILARQSAH